MATSTRPTIPAQSTPSAPSTQSDQFVLSGRPDHPSRAGGEPFKPGADHSACPAHPEDHLHACLLDEDGSLDTPLTSEPPLPDAEQPLTSEPSLTDTAEIMPLTSEPSGLVAASAAGQDFAGL